MRHAQFLSRAGRPGRCDKLAVLFTRSLTTAWPAAGLAGRP